jgi:hypothetical protein
MVGVLLVLIAFWLTHPSDRPKTTSNTPLLRVLEVKIGEVLDVLALDEEWWVACSTGNISNIGSKLSLSTRLYIWLNGRLGASHFLWELEAILAAARREQESFWRCNILTYAMILLLIQLLIIMEQVTPQ